MLYSDLKNFFSRYLKDESIEALFNHISEIDTQVDFNNELFIFCDKLSENTSLELYIFLNEFFNEYQPTISDIALKVQSIKTMICMAASIKVLVMSRGTIQVPFFIIHSVFDYNVDIDRLLVNHKNSANVFLTLIKNYKMLSDISQQILVVFLTEMVLYTKMFSTDYQLIDDMLYNIKKFPGLLQTISNEIFVPFLSQILDWCKDNQYPDLSIYYYIIKDISNRSGNEELYINAELCLYRYHKDFHANYNYRQLEEFYLKYHEKIQFHDQLRIITELFIFYNEDKYIEEFSNKLSEKSENNLIDEIEYLHSNVFSAYIIRTFKKYNEKLYELLEKKYGNTEESINKTAIYLHGDDTTYILNNKKVSEYEVKNFEIHNEIIQQINNINNLAITVFGKSKEQKITQEDQLHRENVPSDIKRKVEAKLVENLEKYYHIGEYEFDDNTQYIFSIQHIRVPLQQLILKEYDKFFPVVKLVNKRDIKQKTVKNVLFATLSHSSTDDMDKEVIEYLDKVSKMIHYEYIEINSIEKLFEVLGDDKYDVIVLTTHGEVDTREALNNHIKVGNTKVNFMHFRNFKPNINKQRLLYLNICDSGHFSLKSGFILESLSTFLTKPYQATVSHMWPIEQKYSSVFLMIFLLELQRDQDFKEAYKRTLSLAVNDKLWKYINDNNLLKLQLFNIFNASSIKTRSITHWGSTLYQE